MATLANLRSRVRFFIDEPVQADFTDVDINYAINRAQERIVDAITEEYANFFIKGPVSFNTAINQELYPIATAIGTDFVSLKRAELALTGETIPIIDINEKSIYGNAVPPLVNIGGAASGQSLYIAGDNIGMTPAPTQIFAVNVYYAYQLPDMVADTDTSNIPSRLHDGMALYAARDCLIKDEADISQLNVPIAEFTDRLIKVCRDRQTQDMRHVRRQDINYQAWRPF